MVPISTHSTEEALSDLCRGQGMAGVMSTKKHTTYALTTEYCIVAYFRVSNRRQPAVSYLLLDLKAEVFIYMNEMCGGLATAIWHQLQKRS